MHAWFRDNGFLSDAGDLVVEDFQESLHRILRCPTGKSLTQAQLLTLEANLKKIVAEYVSDEILKRK